MKITTRNGGGRFLPHLEGQPLGAARAMAAYNLASLKTVRRFRQMPPLVQWMPTISKDGVRPLEEAA